MPRLIITEAAALGMERCRRLLAGKAPEAAKRGAQAIDQRFLLVRSVPHMGRPFADDAALRELAIPFGDSGYVALYRYEAVDDAIYLLAFRHQKEAGY